MIDAVQKSLKLPDSAVELSRRSLAEVGNMSSASVLHVLEKIVDDGRPPPGSLGLMIGLGPGVSVELVLLRVVTGLARGRSMIIYYALLAVIAVERVAELVVSQRHAAASLRDGGVEYGRGHFPVMVALHAALLAGCWPSRSLLHRTFIPALGYPMLALVVAANALRWWCIATLGPRWTARVIVMPGRAAGHGRPVPVVRAPELRRRHRRGRRAAAGRLGLDHRVPGSPC